MKEINYGWAPSKLDGTEQQFKEISEGTERNQANRILLQPCDRGYELSS